MDKIINTFPFEVRIKRIYLLSPILLIILMVTHHAQQIKEIKGIKYINIGKK